MASPRGLVGIGIALLITTFLLYWTAPWSSIYSAAMGGVFILFAYLKTVDARRSVPTFTRKRLIMVALAFIALSAYLYIPPTLRTFAYAASDEKAAAVDPEVVKADTGFAVAIMRVLSKEDQGKNIFISPFSISTALAMTYNGAGGSTKEAMSRTLGIENMTLSGVNEGNLRLLESLESVDETIQLNIANSVWIRNDFATKIRQSFTNGVTTYFKSEVFTRPFDQGTITDVNNWINGKTNQKIPKILDSIDPNEVMFLINAIYFKGDWTKKFDESATHTGGFYLSDGSTVSASFMRQSEDFGYYDSGRFRAARFPYGRDKFAMYVFLPAKGVSLDSFVNDMTQDNLDSWFSSFRGNTKLQVELPKFKIEYGTKRLNEALTNLGMGVAFDRVKANFTGIAPISPSANLFIDFVDHKAYVDVNEKGTEAAAVTVVGIKVTSAPLTIPFIVDRPFLFVIRDDRSGAILFMGKIENPLQATSP
jgi:serpin B